MLLEIKKENNKFVLQNDPAVILSLITVLHPEESQATKDPLKTDHFFIEVDEENIIPASQIEEYNNKNYKTLRKAAFLNRYREKQQREINQEPNLSEIQQLLATLPFKETDEQLLDQYFKQRAKEEGII